MKILKPCIWKPNTFSVSKSHPILPMTFSPLQNKIRTGSNWVQHGLKKVVPLFSLRNRVSFFCCIDYRPNSIYRVRSGFVCSRWYSRIPIVFLVSILFTMCLHLVFTSHLPTRIFYKTLLCPSPFTNCTLSTRSASPLLVSHLRLSCDSRLFQAEYKSNCNGQSIVVISSNHQLQ